MSTTRAKLTRQERVAVRSYLSTMLRHAETAANRLREVDPADRPDYVLRNIQYWDNVRSGFRWAIAQLKHY